MNAVTIAALMAFPGQLEALWLALPAGLRHWAPPSWEGIPSEPLTAIEQVCHVRDVEIDGYHVRLRRTLSELDPVLPALDAEALARQRGYGTTDVTAALGDFRRARQQTVALVDGLTPAQLARSATFEGYGRVSVESLVHYLCSHDQQHLAGLHWLLGKFAAVPPG